jgi:hypothetical protein
MGAPLEIGRCGGAGGDARAGETEKLKISNQESRKSRINPRSVILSHAKDPRERTDVCRPLGSFASLRMT